MFSSSKLTSGYFYLPPLPAFLGESSTPCTLRQWCTICVCQWKLSLQFVYWHEYSLVCVWRRWCSLLLPLEVKALSQNLHLNGLSPVCILSCTWKLDLLRNSLLQAVFLPGKYIPIINKDLIYMSYQKLAQIVKIMLESYLPSLISSNVHLNTPLKYKTN